MIGWNKITAYIRQGIAVLGREEVPMVGEILCNQCGILLWSSTEGNYGRMEYFVAKYVWSKPLSPWFKETHGFHLCQGCYKKMIENFKHKDLINEPADR